MHDDLPTDLIDSLIDNEAIAALRRRRPEALRHAEGAFRELVLPADPGGLSLAERASLALRVAEREGDQPLAARYRALVVQAGDDVTKGDRIDALLGYADRVAMTPEATSRADIEALASLGLTSRDIVAATQLIAFVPYQVRLLAGLRAMMQEGTR